MNQEDAARIGRIHADRVEWPAANILGRPYNRLDNPPRHGIKGHAGLFAVGVSTLGRAEAEAELVLLKAAVDAEAKGSKGGTAKSSESA